MSWKTGTLKDLIFFQRGFDITKAEQKPGNIPVISSSGISSYHSEAMVSGPGVIIGRKGTLGSVHYSADDFWPHDTTLWSKDLKGNSAKYVYYFLKTMRLENYNVGNANPTLNRNHIHDLEIQIPDKNIQDRIADILSAYDDLIENNRRRIDLLEHSSRLLYKEWFVSLRFPGHEHVKVKDGVPQGWQKKTAFDVMNILSGGTPSTQVPGYWDGDIPFYTPRDYADAPYALKTERSITESGLANCSSHLYAKNTIFISARGTVGKIIMAQKPMAMSQTSYALSGKNGLSPFFLYSALQANLQQFLMRATGAVFSAIVVDTFKNIPFILPSQLLIENFEENVTPIFAQIENLLLTNERLQQARDMLLPRLMNGEIPV